jgi:hypothetical protein
MSRPSQTTAAATFPLSLSSGPLPICRSMQDQSPMVVMCIGSEHAPGLRVNGKCVMLGGRSFNRYSFNRVFIYVLFNKGLRSVSQ